MPRKKSPTILELGAACALAVIALSNFASAQAKFVVLYNFEGSPDAGAPVSGVTLGPNNTLLGTAGGGSGCNGGCGTVYKLTRQSNGKWVETVIHNFDQFVGAQGGLVRDPANNFYGSEITGDLLFEITAKGGWNEYPLPLGGSGSTLLMDKAGNMFETAGDIFEISPSSGSWAQRGIFRFHPQSGVDGTDGWAPVGSLITDGHGNLYGATEFGGNYSLCSGSAGCGTVFKLTPNQDETWTEHVLHRFAQFNYDGQLPLAGVVMDVNGNIYGTTLQGGKYQVGTVFRISRGTDGKWHETILHNFTSSQGAVLPSTSLTLDRSGNLYGVCAGRIGGAVFELSPESRGKWTFRVLHEFSGTDGYLPQSGLTLDIAGNLYGTTQFGGKNNQGVVYEVIP